MSEKESKFITVLTSVLGSFLLALAIGAFVFYRTSIVSAAVQDEKINSISTKVETMRVEWREDQKEINTNIDKIATRLNEQAGYILKQGR